MAISVTLRPNINIVSRIKTNKSTVSSVNFGPAPNLTLGQILNVDASNPDNGEALIYDSTVNKYVVKPIEITSNNIPNLLGGIF